MPELGPLYDDLYARGYRSCLAGYELARWEALRHFLLRVTRAGAARRVLDYGAGSGAFVPLWQAVFPRAEFAFCDVSAVALEKLQSAYPEYRGRCRLVRGGRAEMEAESADVIISVEVLEHVEDLAGYAADIYRLLTPGGVFVWTTPCANPLSIEHLYNRLTRQIDPTPEGYRRWRWEDPTHLRRLTSGEAAVLLRRAGFTSVGFRYRAHLFSFVCTHTPARRLAAPVKDYLMRLDYGLFRRLPNGASMLGWARRPAP